MKTITAFVLALALLVTPPAFAQHGRGNSHGHDNSRGRGNGGARSGRDGHFNRDRHGRIDHDVRIVGGRREVFFDGFWFGCDLWPEWVFAGDVYVLTVDDGYVMYSYADPSLSISINLVP